MNPRTLIVVCGYAGDAHQIEINLPAYEHHGCPVIIFSPEDSPILQMGPHICYQLGQRAYVGQGSLDRQWLHMQKALSLGFDYYLFHDSDSICVNPTLPAKLYAPENSGIVWSNEVVDHREPGYHDPLPHIAMQPPYFMDRRALEKMVQHGQQVADSTTPYIDWYMVQVTFAAGLPYRKLPKSVSFGTVPPENAELMANLVRKGEAEFLHSIKTKPVFDSCMQAFQNRPK